MKLLEDLGDALEGRVDVFIQHDPQSLQAHCLPAEVPTRLLQPRVGALRSPLRRPPASGGRDADLAQSPIARRWKRSANWQAYSILKLQKVTLRRCIRL